MNNDKEMNDVEMSFKNIKNEAFQKEIAVYQEKLSAQCKENNQLMAEADKMEKILLQLVGQKCKLVEEIISSKTQMTLTKQENEVMQNYLSAIIKSQAEKGARKINQSEKIIKMIVQISSKENNINQLIKRSGRGEEMINLILNPKETEVYLREILS